ncbi:MAG: PilN domain-containing protein [Tateyamaria sp.]|uniref:PilN domain-containing protein n=1 Tax=Tateyamaria sp. TaxID=1929288 RepID=UPI00329DD09E
MLRFDIFSDWFAALFLGAPRARKLLFSDDVTKIEYRSGTYIAPSSLLHADGPVVAAMKRTVVVDVQVPEHSILSRALEIPRAAKSKINEVALLDLMRKTPFSPQEVHLASAASKPREGFIPLRQWLIKRNEAEGLIKRLEAPGVKVRKLLVDNADGPVLLDRRREIAQGAKWLRALNASLAGVCVTTVLIWWLYPAWQASSSLPVLLETNTQKQQTVFELRQELDERLNAATTDELFVRQIVARVRLVDLLRNLTVALPDEVWISDMTLRGGTVLITGETKASATGLVLTLAERSGFSNPRLSGPVSRTRAGAEQFQLAISLQEYQQ